MLKDRLYTKCFIADNISLHEAAHALMAFRENYPMGEVNIDGVLKYTNIPLPMGKGYISEYILLAGLAAYELFRHPMVINLLDDIKNHPDLAVYFLNETAIGILESQQDIKQFAMACNLNSELYMELLLCITPIWNCVSKMGIGSIRRDRLYVWQECFEILLKNFENEFIPQLRKAIKQFVRENSHDDSTWDFVIEVLNIKDSIKKILKEPQNQNCLHELDRFISEKKHVSKSEVEFTALKADQIFALRKFFRKFVAHLGDFCYLILDMIFRIFGGALPPKVHGAWEFKDTEHKTNAESRQREKESIRQNKQLQTKEWIRHQTEQAKRTQDDHNQKREVPQAAEHSKQNTRAEEEPIDKNIQNIEAQRHYRNVTQLIINKDYKEACDYIRYNKDASKLLKGYYCQQCKRFVSPSESSLAELSLFARRQCPKCSAPLIPVLRNPRNEPIK